jgi:hypothetical protein
MFPSKTICASADDPVAAMTAIEASAPFQPRERLIVLALLVACELSR